MELIRTNSENDDFRTLIRQLDTDLNIRYGELQQQYDAHNRVEKLDTAIVAYIDNAPAGCGCFKQYDDDTAEIKRMFVLPVNRGKGIATRILGELENWAREKKYKKTLLETGSKQFEAINMYKKSGYVQTENFGQYAGNTNSICMKKILIWD